MTIDAKEILGVDGGDRFKLYNQSKDKIASSVALTYIDPLRELDDNSATVYNSKSFETNDVNVRIPYALSRNDAFSGAERMMRAAWSKKQKLTFNLPVTSDDFLSVGDLVRFINEPIIEGSNWVVIEQSFSTNFFIEYTCVLLNRIVYAYAKNVNGTFVGRNSADDPIDLQNAVIFEAIDSTLLSSTDNHRDGIYFAYEVPGSASSATVYYSTDNGITYDILCILTSETITGRLLTDLPSSDYQVTDETNSIFVQLTDSAKALISVTPAEFETGAQVLHVNGEYISYRDATNLGNGVFELTGLTRGYRSTEPFVALQSAGSSIAFLRGDSTSDERCPLPISDTGTVLFKVLLQGVSDLDASVTQNLNYEANASKSLSPIALQPTQSGNDWIVEYVPRGINDTAEFLNNGLPLPSNVDGNTFEVELFNGATLIKSVFVNGNNFTYTQAAQIADTGGLVTDFNFCVYQIRDNSAIGRGFKSIGAYA